MGDTGRDGLISIDSLLTELSEGDQWNLKPLAPCPTRGDPPRQQNLQKRSRLMPPPPVPSKQPCASKPRPSPWSSPNSPASSDSSVMDDIVGPAPDWETIGRSAGGLHVPGRLCVGGDTLKAGGSAMWTVVSDGRLKDVVATFDLGAGELAQLTPRVFKYKAGLGRGLAGAVPDREYVGLIAQEVPEPLARHCRVRTHVRLRANDAELTEIFLLDHSCLQFVAINAIKAHGAALAASAEASAALSDRVDMLGDLSSAAAAEASAARLRDRQLATRLEHLEAAFLGGGAGESAAEAAPAPSGRPGLGSERLAAALRDAARHVRHIRMSLRLGLIFAMGVASAANLARVQMTTATGCGPIEMMGGVYVLTALYVFIGGDVCTTRGAHLLTGVLIAWVGLAVPAVALRSVDAVRTSVTVRAAPGSHFPFMWAIGGTLLSALQLSSRIRLFTAAWVLTAGHLAYAVAYTRLRDEPGIEEKIITLSLRTTLPLTLSMMATSFAVGLLRPCAAIADALHEEVGAPTDGVGERRSDAGSERGANVELAPAAAAAAR